MKIIFYFVPLRYFLCGFCYLPHFYFLPLVFRLFAVPSYGLPEPKNANTPISASFSLYRYAQITVFDAMWLLYWYVSLSKYFLVQKPTTYQQLYNRSFFAALQYPRTAQRRRKMQIRRFLRICTVKMKQKLPYLRFSALASRTMVLRRAEKRAAKRKCEAESYCLTIS